MALALPETLPMLPWIDQRVEIGAGHLEQCEMPNALGRGIGGRVRAQHNRLVHHDFLQKQLLPSPHLGASDCVGGVPRRVDGSLLPQAGADAETSGLQS